MSRRVPHMSRVVAALSAALRRSVLRFLHRVFANKEVFAITKCHCFQTWRLFGDGSLPADKSRSATVQHYCTFGCWLPRGLKKGQALSVAPLLRPCCAPVAPLFRPCFAPVSPLFRPCFAPVSPLFRPCFAPVSPLFRPCQETQNAGRLTPGVLLWSPQDYSHA
jgi:hypothetical protein